MIDSDWLFLLSCRLQEMSPGVPLSVIYGGQSWITSMTKEELETARGNQGYTNVYVS